MGLLIIAVGVLFTLDNLGLIEARRTCGIWPVGLIGDRTMKLWAGGRGATFRFAVLPRRRWLLLQSMSIVTISLWSLWPVLLILAGGSMIWRGINGPACERGLRDTDSHSTISAMAVLGGVNRGNNSRTFRGGDLTAVMGGCQIDLRSAAIEGEAVIDVFAMWGGIEIKVPENWSVSGRVTPVPRAATRTRRTSSRSPRRSV